MLSLAAASLSFAGNAVGPAQDISMMARGKSTARKSTRKAAPQKSGAAVAELAGLVQEQQIPSFVPLNQDGILDPLGFTKLNLYDFPESGTVGWLRHAEIKHGRVAMFAFVGYIVHANHIVFPWALTGGPLGNGETTMFADISAAGAPIDQWAAVPTSGKLQILGTIALLEFVGETTTKDKPHYTKGGMPGYVPPIKEFPGVPHPIPFNLYDPFDQFSDRSEAEKARGRNVEINNGRAAMLGIFGFISASKGLIVPGLDALGLEQSTGNPMGFFSASDAGLPFVQQMIDGWSLPF